jgi:hypothetical protein
MSFDGGDTKDGGAAGRSATKHATWRCRPADCSVTARCNIHALCQNTSGQHGTRATHVFELAELPHKRWIWQNPGSALLHLGVCPVECLPTPGPQQQHRNHSQDRECHRQRYASTNVTFACVVAGEQPTAPDAHRQRGQPLGTAPLRCELRYRDQHNQLTSVSHPSATQTTPTEPYPIRPASICPPLAKTTQLPLASPHDSISRTDASLPGDEVGEHDGRTATPPSRAMDQHAGALVESLVNDSEALREESRQDFCLLVFHVDDVALNVHTTVLEQLPVAVRCPGRFSAIEGHNKLDAVFNEGLRQRRYDELGKSCGCSGDAERSSYCKIFARCQQVRQQRPGVHGVHHGAPNRTA